MSDGPYCACRRVAVTPIENGDGTKLEHWMCTECNTPFVKTSRVSALRSELLSANASLEALQRERDEARLMLRAALKIHGQRWRLARAMGHGFWLDEIRLDTNADGLPILTDEARRALEETPRCE